MQMMNKRNVILIGMPGCGKTSVGRELSKLSGRPFYDCDEEVEKASGKSIEEIFALWGEEKFRELEHRALSELLKGEGLIIASGGGAVKSAENRRIIKERADAVWIRRDIDLLPRDGRPLSASADLLDMYRERASLYQMTSDFIVENDTTAYSAAKKCAEVLEL